ncbi:MAG: PhoH family protein [Planctomycetota bacterium]|jgi:PhoH-like ATPase
MSKTFVVDTNVFLHNANAIESFADNTVVLPMAVIEELDKFKTHSDELGRNARAVIRRIDELRGEGSLREGVPMENGGTLKIITSQSVDIETGLMEHITDNRIIRVAFGLHSAGESVIFVSKDINARLKADALGIKAQDFEKEKVKFDELFSGQSEIIVKQEVIDEFYKEDVMVYEDIDAFPNEFVLLTDETNPKHTGLARVGEKGQLRHLNSHYEYAWNIKPRSKEQRIALELLMDPSVQLVTLVGQAGTGKTLLALAAGLEATLHNKQYEKILVSRPIIPMGKDIGFLPGDKDQKLTHWMQPIFDNLSYLLQDKNSKKAEEEKGEKKIEELQNQHLIELEALTYIRGRSISNQYVVVDEAQNLTPHEIKTIISRAGDGTKMVLTGDPYQIDNPYLDASSNGLTYAVERLKSISLHGHVTLRKSERSTLAGVAADLL